MREDRRPRSGARNPELCLEGIATADSSLSAMWSRRLPVDGRPHLAQGAGTFQRTVGGSQVVCTPSAPSVLVLSQDSPPPDPPRPSTHPHGSLGAARADARCGTGARFQPVRVGRKKWQPRLAEAVLGDARNPRSLPWHRRGWPPITRGGRASSAISENALALMSAGGGLGSRGRDARAKRCVCSRSRTRSRSWAAGWPCPGGRSRRTRESFKFGLNALIRGARDS